jgi:hypothetical protein
MAYKLPTIYEKGFKPIDRDLYEKSIYFNVVSTEYPSSSSSSYPIHSPIHSPIHYRHVYPYTIIPNKERFDSILVGKSLMVYKGSSNYKHYLRYFDGFFVLKKLFKKKVISIKGVKSCTRINYTITFDTFDHGFLILRLEKLEDSICIENVVNSLISEN